MNRADEAIFAAIKEADHLRDLLGKKQNPQVRGADRSVVRATALAWFNNHRKQLVPDVLSEIDLYEIDAQYKKIMEATHRNSSRATYRSDLRKTSGSLARLRTENVVKLSKASERKVEPPASDIPPDFSPLISDIKMKEILERRWIECSSCITANAPLAAVVMMGGLLEGLLLARILRESNQTPIFKASAAPKDKAGKPLPHLRDWTLQDFIGVAHELKWITTTGKDIGIVLRDYRNYIHPQKELSHGISLNANDADLLCQIGKGIAKQLLKSVK